MSNRKFQPTTAPQPITHSDQIKNLPWAGNFGSDSLLFKECDRYIMNPNITMEERRKALFEMGLWGMGLDEKVAKDEIVDYMKQCGELTDDLLKRYLSEVEALPD